VYLSLVSRRRGDVRLRTLSFLSGHIGSVAATHVSLLYDSCHSTHARIQVCGFLDVLRETVNRGRRRGNERAHVLLRPITPSHSDPKRACSVSFVHLVIMEKAAVARFFSAPSYAVAGASADPAKFGHKGELDSWTVFFRQTSKRARIQAHWHVSVVR
jgi:hypothetical protein